MWCFLYKGFFFFWKMLTSAGFIHVTLTSLSTPCLIRFCRSWTTRELCHEKCSTRNLCKKSETTMSLVEALNSRFWSSPRSCSYSPILFPSLEKVTFHSYTLIYRQSILKLKPLFEARITLNFINLNEDKTKDCSFWSQWNLKNFHSLDAFVKSQQKDLGWYLIHDLTLKNRLVQLILDKE